MITSHCMKSLFIAAAMALLAPAAAHAQERDKPYVLARPELVNSKLVLNRELIDRGTQQVKDLNGRGPINQPIALGEVLNVDGRREFPGFNGLQDLSNLSLTVFPDANRESGIYYYLPTSYFLKWEESTGYYLTLDYGVETSSKKNVILSARLSPGRLDEDRELIKALLAVWLQQQPTPPPHALFNVRLVPLVVSYEVEFDWKTLGVPKEDLKSSGVDPDTREMGLTVTCDVGTAALLVKKLGDPLGIDGAIRVIPQKVGAEAALPATWMPARLRFAERTAYCDQKWVRERGDFTSFKNRHPFPVRIKSLCYLYRSGTSVAIRGYDLKDQLVEPGQTAKVPNAKIHPEIDSDVRIVRAWFDYTLESREDLVNQLVDRVTGGVGNVPVQSVAMDVIGGAQAFEQNQVNKIIVMVRSDYLDPKGTKGKEERYEFSARDADAKTLRLYVPSSAGEKKFEWRIGLIMNDGNQHLEEKWRGPPALGQISIGSRQIEEVLAK